MYSNDDEPRQVWNRNLIFDKKEKYGKYFSNYTREISRNVYEHEGAKQKFPAVVI